MVFGSAASQKHLLFLLLFYISKWKSLSRVWLFLLYSSWNSPGENTRVGSLSLLQGIFPSQGSNPGLPHCRQILYQLSHKRSPRILEWVAYPFSSRSSQPRNQTRVSYTAGRFFTNWAIREAPVLMSITLFGNRFFADDQIKTRSLGEDLI